MQFSPLLIAAFVAIAAACDTCGPAPQSGGNIGDACSSDGMCNGDFYCFNAKCAKLGNSGDACTCDQNCNGNLGCWNGCCAALKTAGESCYSHDQCSGALQCKSGKCCAGL